MKTKIFSFVKISENSIVASVRIARFISETLDLAIINDESISDEPLDILIIINGAYAFSGPSILASLGKAIEEAGRVVWVQNDYTVIPPKDESGAESPFRKAFRNRFAAGKPATDYWTTCLDMSRPGVAKTGHRIGERSRYINWNALTTWVMKSKTMSTRKHSESLIYYGAFRKDRVHYFDRYFAAPTVPTVISCPNNKFDHYTRVIHETKLESLPDYISEFGLGLYLEDKRSHREFHSPANRFYEMLSAGLPMVFQPEAMRMMEKAGYEISQWVVFSTKDIPAMMEKREQILIDQRTEWLNIAISSRESLPGDVKSAWEFIQS